MAEISREELRLRNRRRRKRILKRRRRILTGTVAAAFVIIIIAVMAASGRLDKKSEVTTLTVDGKGRIIFEEVLAATDPDEAAIRSFTEEKLKEFNDINPDNRVKLNTLSVKKDRIYLKTTYNNARVYEAFTAHTLFNGAIEAANKEGIVISGAFVATGVQGASTDGVKASSDDSEKSADEISRMTDKRILIIDQPITVRLPSDALYISDTGCSYDKNTVMIPDEVITYIVY